MFTLKLSSNIRHFFVYIVYIVLVVTVLVLFRGLPLEIKAIGDSYVKDEFR